MFIFFFYPSREYEIFFAKNQIFWQKSCVTIAALEKNSSNSIWIVFHQNKEDNFHMNNFWFEYLKIFFNKEFFRRSKWSSCRTIIFETWLAGMTTKVLFIKNPKNVDDVPICTLTSIINWFFKRENFYNSRASTHFPVWGVSHLSPILYILQYFIYFYLLSYLFWYSSIIFP